MHVLEKNIFLDYVKMEVINFEILYKFEKNFTEKFEKINSGKLRQKFRKALDFGNILKV